MQVFLALGWLQDLPIYQVIVECDYKTVVDSIREQGPNNANYREFGNMIRACMSILS